MAKRFLTMSGLAIVLVAVCYGLFVHPDQAAYLFPAAGLAFLWAEWRGERHVQPLFFLLLPAIAFAAAYRAQAQIPVLGIELAAACAAGIFIRREREFLEGERSRLEEEVQEARKGSEDLRRNLNYHLKHREIRRVQSRLRRDFAEAARNIASAMSYDDIRTQLMAALKRYFPQATASLVSGAPRDSIERFAASKHVPVLVSDPSLETRFRVSSDLRSAVVVPLYLSGKVAGFIRLESPEPGALKNQDLRTVDLFSTLATLAMENARLYEQVQKLAVHDGLTQLFTHRAFQNRLQEEILRSARSQTPLTIVMCDIDHFKAYNDNFGHQAGDQLLKTVAAILSSFARDVDFVARYGGEEFAIILPSTVRDRGAEIAEAIRQRIASEPFMFQGKKTQVTMSLGIASFPQDAATGSQLIRSADERLYRAKRGGRNQVVA